jgi:hypothetical protein
MPLSDSGGGLTVRVEVPGQAPLGVHLNNVAGNYFSVMGTRVLAGRGISPDDRENSPPVVVISQLLARQVFGGRNPLGERLMVEGKMREVVGVSEDGPSNDLHEKLEPFLYVPLSQLPMWDITLILETAGDPGALAQPARRELKRYDPSVTVLSLNTLRQRMQQALTFDQLLAAISTSLGVFGFLLTAAGLFGVIQYAVNRRTREIGLRMSLGAKPADIGKMVLAESVRMAAWGIPVGLLLLAAVAWSVRSMVLGVAPLDPLTYLSASAMAVAVALAASWLPAQRATRVDPMTALRADFNAKGHTVEGAHADADGQVRNDTVRITHRRSGRQLRNSKIHLVESNRAGGKTSKDEIRMLCGVERRLWSRVRSEVEANLDYRHCRRGWAWAPAWN